MTTKQPIKRVLFDTDIGTDVDDCLALALVLASPELHLEGVTCVYGDVRLRAQMIAKLLRLAGRSEVPVFLGAERPLLDLRPIFWQGHEGVGLLTPDDPPFVAPAQHAVDYLIETVLANPGEIHLLAIGPLTNVALALRKAPHMAQALGSLMIMGGALRGPGQWHLPYAEHNIVCDPEAAHVVFTSDAPITLVPLDVTTQVQIYQQGEARIRAAGSAWHVAVADQVALYPRFAQTGTTFLHDPLAASLLVDPTLVEYQPLHIAVELSGRLAAGATLVRRPNAEHPANAQVAVRVARERFEEWFIERLAAQRGLASEA
jgi:purine nucleosidase